MNREARRRCGRAGHPNRKGAICFDCMSVRHKDGTWAPIKRRADIPTEEEQ